MRKTAQWYMFGITFLLLTQVGRAQQIEIQTPTETSAWEEDTDHQVAIPVILSQPAVDKITLQYKVVGSATATPGVDYVSADGFLTFNPGQNYKAVYVQVKGNTTFNPDKQLKVQWSNPVGATLGFNPVETSLLIRDDDGQPDPSKPCRVSIGSQTFKKPLKGTSAFIPVEVRLSAPSDKKVYIFYTTQDGSTGKKGLDFKTTVGLLTIPPGKTQAILSLEVYNSGPGDKIFQVIPQKAVWATVDKPGYPKLVD